MSFAKHNGVKFDVEFCGRFVLVFGFQCVDNELDVHLAVGSDFCDASVKTYQFGIVEHETLEKHKVRQTHPGADFVYCNHFAALLVGNAHIVKSKLAQGIDFNLAYCDVGFQKFRQFLLGGGADFVLYGRHRQHHVECGVDNQKCQKHRHDDASRNFVDMQ